MRFTFIVMVDYFQSEVSVALDKRRSSNGKFVRPFPANVAEHNVLHLIVLQPRVKREPIGAKSSSFSDGRVGLFGSLGGVNLLIR